MVVYQSQSKIDWLHVDSEGLTDPIRGPVSAWASLALAKGILLSTPRADVSAAITGHFGPNAPPDQEGLVFCAMMTREGTVQQFNFHLESPAPILATDWKLRLARQNEATSRFLLWIDDAIPWNPT